MNPIIQWIQKEILKFVFELFKYLNYYTLRDRILFFVTINYVLGEYRESKMHNEISISFLELALAVGIVSFIFLLFSVPSKVLFGFKWNYLAPIQYTSQICALYYIAWKKTDNVNYSIALAYNGAAATGYLYEFPFWFYSVKKAQAHLLHTSFRYIFLVDFQIISIIVFIMLLRKQEIKIGKKEIALFLCVLGFSFIMGSQMYVISSTNFIRLPMMAYSLYLCKKMWRSNEIKEET